MGDGLVRPTGLCFTDGGSIEWSSDLARFLSFSSCSFLNS